MGSIVLYYKYVDIEDPQKICRWQKSLCASLGLTGRILIAHEGINGTAGGTDEAMRQYIASMQAHPLFADIDYKLSSGGAEHFPRMRIAVRDEIVTLGVDPHTVSYKESGEHLEPQQVHKLVASKPKNLIILDARNTYETRIGKFTDAVVPDIENFRELPAYLDAHQTLFKDKEVLMYCTGGVRCERATAYLKAKNIAKKVYQIKGGIHRYIEQFPDGFFRGKNYVFDGRISVAANSDILTDCAFCNLACDEYTNCVNARCNEQFIACGPCLETTNNTCGPICAQRVKNKEVGERTTPARTKKRDDNKKCPLLP